MTNQQKKMERLLNETISYYSENPKRRCAVNGKCFYDPASVGKEDISDGCAIGRLMTVRQKKKADKDYRARAINFLPSDLIPRRVRGLSMIFLSAIQTLHDESGYWNSKGLSKIGRIKVERIRKEWL
jgi:hypothetical protein